MFVHFVRKWCQILTEYRDKCTECGSAKGYKWHWGKNDGHSKGYSECLNCGKEYR